MQVPWGPPAFTSEPGYTSASLGFYPPPLPSCDPALCAPGVLGRRQHRRLGTWASHGQSVAPSASRGPSAHLQTPGRPVERCAARQEDRCVLFIVLQQEAQHRTYSPALGCAKQGLALKYKWENMILLF